MQEINCVPARPAPGLILVGNDGGNIISISGTVSTLVRSLVSFHGPSNFVKVILIILFAYLAHEREYRETKNMRGVET